MRKILGAAIRARSRNTRQKIFNAVTYGYWEQSTQENLDALKAVHFDLCGKIPNKNKKKVFTED